MSKAGFLSGSSLARIPSVARVLGFVSAAEAPGEEDTETPNDDPPAEDPPADDPPADDPPAEDPPADDPPADEPPAALASLSALSADDRVALIGAFERDANALVSAERERCIGIFTSDAGRRNVDGAASVIRETDMSVEKAGTFLSSFGNSRTAARDRLNGDPSTRTRTGQGNDSTTSGAATDAKSAHKKRREQRNKSVKGGKRVGAEASGDQD